jgi:hypothetical protein
MPELAQCSYLLRLWREHDEQPWRVTLIAVAQPDTHQHFSTLEDCFAFLHAQAATPNETSKGETYPLYIRY